MFGALLAAVVLGQAEGSADDPLARAQARYDAEYVGFEDGLAPNDLGVTRDVTVPYLGKQREPLIGERAYLVIDRPDLARQYQIRKVAKWSAVFGGLAIASGGLAYRQLLAPCLQRDASGACVSRDPLHGTIGLGVMIAGFSAFVVGLMVNPNPVVGEEFKVLAREHNERLRRELGLPPLSLGLSWSRDALALSLAGRF